MKSPLLLKTAKRWESGESAAGDIAPRDGGAQEGEIPGGIWAAST